ncbi:hypothetical protein [Butyrivibrio sp. AE2005]|uniref:hypothetical protein n=1 Tax=Butyrivibrio sp. AE2005 TaxID=1496722 RepID=UPI00047B74C0|nr:hypothetical protein [Butyrivibrio sp. AE2005]
MNESASKEMKMVPGMCEGGNADSLIRTIGGVVLALLFVGVLFGLYGVSKGFFDKAGNKLSQMSVTMDESQYTEYDGAVISGTQVISFIKAHENDEICVSVNNGHTTTSYIYSSTDLSSKDGIGAVSAAQNKANLSTVYINPNSKYLGEIVRDSVDAANGTIVGVNFTIQTS